MKIVALGLLGMVSLTAAGAEHDFELRTPNAPQICHAVNETLNRLDQMDFLTGAWLQKVGGIVWKSDAYPTIVAGGSTEQVEFKYASVDIDNDGSLDIVIIETSMFRSVYMDSLYVLRPSTFLRARKDKNLGTVLSNASEMADGNVVMFSNKDEAVPVEMQVLVQENISYVLLREHFFGEPGAKYANEFFVEKLGKASGRDLGARLSPAQICRFVWR